MNQHTALKLTGYSAMAGAFVLMAENASSQIIYTEPDPDTLLLNIFCCGETERIIAFDLNDDAVNDIGFRITSNSISTSEGSSSMKLSVINYTGNSIRNNFATDYFGVEIISSGDIIDATDIWNNAPSPRMAFTFADFYYESGSDLTQFSTNGFWHNQNEKFIGIRFLIDGDVHFAWMRLTVQTNPEMFPDYFIIHDYAYEASPGLPIEAGAGMDSFIADNHGVQDFILNANYVKWPAVATTDADFLLKKTNEKNTDEINSWYAEGAWYVYLTNEITLPVSLQIINATGQTVLQNEVSQKENCFRLNLPGGIYIATIYSGDKMYSKKIVIQK